MRENRCNIHFNQSNSDKPQTTRALSPFDGVFGRIFSWMREITTRCAKICFIVKNSFFNTDNGVIGVK